MTMGKKYTFIELQRLFRSWVYQQEFINEDGLINKDFLAWLEIEDRINLPIKKVETKDEYYQCPYCHKEMDK